MITRRQFIAGSAAVASAAWSGIASAADGPKRYRVCLIGHAGRGNYGHGLDAAIVRPDTEVVGVADPDEKGRAKGAATSGALRQYADYHEMLEKEKPDLVVIGMRYTDQHHDAAVAALNVGAHLLTEKPFMTTLAEADEVLALAQKTGRKIAVAHQYRITPSVWQLKKGIAEQGLIGELLQLNAFGKQDKRAGGEDMAVLGVHVFDLMRLFAGDPLWCTARVLQDGRDITRADAHLTKDFVGPVAGNEIAARFAFANSVNGTFTSNRKLAENTGVWGLELIGSKASARITLPDYSAPVYLRRPGTWAAAGRTDAWEPLDLNPGDGDKPSTQPGPANKRLIDDWLAAIAENREPFCSGENATKAIEMAMGVYEAALSGQRVNLPLKKRTHPLAE